MSVHSTGLVGKDWKYIVVVLTEYPPSKNWTTPTKAVTTGVQALAPILK
jgi:hypothetical protein